MSKLTALNILGGLLGPFKTSHFTCAEFNANERKQWIFLICIRFSTCKMRRLKRALATESSSDVVLAHLTTAEEFL